MAEDPKDSPSPATRNSGEQPSPRPPLLPRALPWILVLVLSGLGAWGLATLAGLDAHPPRDVAEFIVQTPLLAFKEISFEKYLVFGKPAGTPSWSDRLSIYFVRGRAKISIDLSSLSVVAGKTDPRRGRLVLAVDRPRMFRVDVDIAQGDIYGVETLEPRPMSASEAKPFVEATAAAGGLLGTWAGSALGGAAASRFGPLSLLAGSLGGAALGGGAAWLATSRFASKVLVGAQGPGASIADREIMVAGAKRLIAMELLGSPAAYARSDWESSLLAEYERSFRTQAARLFAQLGWREVEIQGEAR